MTPRLIILFLFLFALKLLLRFPVARANGVKKLVPLKTSFTKLCKTCKKRFDPTDNNSVNSCIYHVGRWMGAENSKHFGIKSGAVECKSLSDDITLGYSYFWDCCKAEDVNDPGCRKGRHISYDDVSIEFDKFVNKR